MGQPPASEPEPTVMAQAVAELRGGIGLRDLQAADGARELLRSSDPSESWGQLREIGTWLSGATGKCPPRQLTDIRLITVNRDEPLANLVGARVSPVEIPPEADVAQAFTLGRQITDEAVDGGADLLIPLGPGAHAAADSVTCAALAGAFLQLSPVAAVGLVGHRDELSWADCLRAVRQRLRGLPSDPVGALTQVADGPALAIVGMLLQAAQRRTPVLLDGSFVLCCALAARRLVEDSAHWWLVADSSPRLHQERARKALHAQPIVNCGLGLDDASAAALAVGFLRRAQELFATATPAAPLLLPVVEPSIDAEQWDPQGEGP